MKNFLHGLELMLIMNNFIEFNLDHVKLTKYLFLTGKGGVGKTSTACALAVGLADRGMKVLLVSTDPASNLQDVFKTGLNGIGVSIEGIEQKPTIMSYDKNINIIYSTYEVKELNFDQVAWAAKIIENSSTTLNSSIDLYNVKFRSKEEPSLI